MAGKEEEMELGKVVGQVVATARVPRLPQNSLLLVDILDNSGKPSGLWQVALDPVGAGEGEWVLLARGSSARNAHSQDSVLDLAVVAIVDQVSCRENVLYSKT